jgi:S-DNA-T family DNA segregation ATPase FtsK/SpoIIIE
MVSDARQYGSGSRKGSRAFGVIFLALGAFLAVSLLSYSPQDYPNSSNSPNDSVNWAGRTGAYFAYGAFFGIGYAAYLLPVLALVWGRNRLSQRPISHGLYRSGTLLSVCFLFCIGAGLPLYSSYTAFELGGWLGTYASEMVLIPYAGRIGSAILLVAISIAALMLTTDINLRPAARVVVVGASWVSKQLRLLIRSLGTLITSRMSWSSVCRYLRYSRSAVSGKNLSAVKPVPEETDRSSASLHGTATGSTNHPVFSASEQTLPEIRRDIPVAPSPVGTSSVESEPLAAIDNGNKRAQLARFRMPMVGAVMDTVPSNPGELSREELLANARVLEDALSDFDVSCKVVEVMPGPVVTRYELEPASGVKVNRIVTLTDDLARVMSARGIRIQAPVPGKSVVGIEIANQSNEVVYLRDILESGEFKKAPSKLTMALGKSITGEPFVADLAQMPHLLIAGATGSGKSVCINSLISSILFKASPEEVRLLMVDPKVVELTVYNGIPHLLVPVITEPQRASEALRWTVAEMEVRYRKLAELGVRNLADYNRKLPRVNKEDQKAGIEPTKPLPHIVVIVDEFADLMLTAPADVETSLMRLAQKSRAVGIHIILATQRPSVNVITGVIKANFPSRIAFQVPSKTDSRTILDLNGAERLLGRGDMLFLPGGQGEPIRVHGAYISGDEIERLVESLQDSEYEIEDVAVFSEHTDINDSSAANRDELFDGAVRLTVESEQASTSFLQRRMKIGYSRAARLMDQLEAAGIVGPAEGAKPRKIFVTAEDLESTIASP